MDYPTLVYPKHFTALDKPCDTPSFFQENPITVVMFTLERPDIYDPILLSASTYSGQVRWMVSNDMDKLIADNKEVITPTLILCKEQKNLKGCLTIYKHIAATEPYVVLITTPDIAIRNAESLYGVHHCSDSPYFEAIVLMLTTTILAPMMLPSIIGIDYSDVASLISHKQGRILLSTAKHETDVTVAIRETLASLKNRLSPKPEAKYAIGFLSAPNIVTLDEFEMLQEGLNDLFGEVESVIATLESDENDSYCGVMVVI